MKYHCGLLVVTVIAFFSLTSVNASDNFVKISLPKGVSIELPKNWIVLSNDLRITIDTMVDSGLDLAGIEYENTDLPFAANYFKNGETVGISNIRYYSNLDFTQNDSRQATLQDINALNTTLKESIVKSMTAAGMSVLSWTGTKKSTINGITVFVTEYRRKSIKGIEAFRVRLIRVLAGDRSFTLTVSYAEEESFFLKTITDRIISSLKLSDISETTTSNSQVYTKPTSNTGSIVSRFWVAICTWLALSAVYTWGIGLTPPLLIRFLIVRRPIGKWWAIGTVIGFFFINTILFIILNKVIADAVGSRPQIHNPVAMVLIAVASYFILRKKRKYKSQSKNKHTREKAIETKIGAEDSVVSSKSSIISKSKQGSTGAGVFPCPKCSQLNTTNRSTCKGCGWFLYCPKCSQQYTTSGNTCDGCGWEREAATRNRLEKDEVHKKKSKSPKSTPPLLKEEVVTSKAFRYLAIGVSVLITLVILHINDGPFFDDGIFAWYIQDTMAFELLRELFGGYGHNDEAYFLWFVCFGGGVLLSWKCRFKMAGVLIKVAKAIHKKA